MKPLSRRQEQVLQATVHHYVDTMEPVGSRTLVQRFSMPASSATIRSAMGALEQRGLLTQPHTSSGRIPSALGYRHYVDCLLPEPSATVHHLERELTGLSLGWAALDDLLLQIARRLTDFTGLMSLITRPERPQPQLAAIRLVQSGERLLVMLVENSGHASHLNLRHPHATSDELDAIERWAEQQLRGGSLNWEKLPTQLQRSGDVLRHALEHPSISAEPTTLVHGLSRLVAEPEFQSAQDLGPLLQLIDDEPMALISPGAEARVLIGQEHPQSALEACSVVQAPYRCGHEGTGHVALIGPMRMAYATACSAVERVARHLELLLS